MSENQQSKQKVNHVGDFITGRVMQDADEIEASCMDESGESKTSVEEGLQNALGKVVDVGSDNIFEAFKEPWTAREVVFLGLTVLCVLGIIAKYFILR